ncbi:hypothetical protein [Segetibacter sp.]|uniref:hypothetical protein n=1 Tax=Segetibacter sp. TaxID=2231182 RepID=UPI0026235F7B|nr:hypothetical protein [Segetibacter sp.]
MFEKIRQQRPSTLFVASDGARESRPEEAAVCEECRNIVLNGIDWPCEVKTLFRSENLGCGKAVSSAISWFFDNVEEGIILEDDVVPTRSFFSFCRKMLSKFRDDTGIMHVSGNNFQLSRIGSDSYYLSKIPHCWGWATWRRAWQKFDFELKLFKEDQKPAYFDYPTIDNYWHNIFKLTKNQLYRHVWDYQWVFALFNNNALSIAPQYNLVSNVGFGTHSTNTHNDTDYLANLKSYEVNFEIKEDGMNYNPGVDINFQKLFRWEMIEEPPINISGKVALRILISKLKQKLLR